MEKINIAVAQMDIKWHGVEENKIKAEQFLKEAAQNGCDLVVLPEMAFTGFSMKSNEVADLNNGITNFVSTLCSKYKIGCVFGFAAISERGKPQNLCAAISADGEILGQYAKIHPFSFAGEHKYYERGSKTAFFKIKDTVFSMFICYDIRFPEIFQAVSKDAHAIIVIANWPKERQEHWDILLKARAIENQCWIIGCNRVGDANKTQYIGGSAIISPMGDVACSQYVEEKLLTYTIDGNEAITLRNTFPLKNDRDTELYSRLQNPLT